MDRRLELKVFGNVQGVNFRMHTAKQAQKLGLKGVVQNEPDGSVRVIAEGDEGDLQDLSQWAEEGPDSSYVTDVHEHWGEATGQYQGFQVVR
jgi:acylphosphatase